MPENHNAPEQRTIDVDVRDLDTRGRTVVGYAAVYNTESGDLGGFRERIAPGAFASVLDADVRCLLNHDPNVVLGRTKSGTMRLSDDARGLRFEVDLPESRNDLREAVGRGDLDGASFRFKVGDESWDGDLRTIQTVKELRDVTLATYPAYPAASIELRTRPEIDNGAERQEGANMPLTENQDGAAEERSAENTETTETTEERTERPTAGLQVEDRASAGNGSLISVFESRGFPNEAAAMSWDEYRTATFTGDVDTLAPLRTDGVALGADQRYAYPAFPQSAVGADVTSVQVLRQSSRTLPDAEDVIRDIDAVTAKPEVATATAVLSVGLNQVAAIETNIPNVILEQSAIESLVQNDLRLALNEGLDQLVLDQLALAPSHDGSDVPLLVAIRQGVTIVQAAGYAPNTLILSPSDAEAIDTLVAETGTEHYVFAPGQFAPGSLFGLSVRVSKSVLYPVVVDAAAFGRMHIAPVELARFEADAGTTNRSNVRLETNAVFGAERLAAAVRIEEGS